MVNDLIIHPNGKIQMGNSKISQSSTYYNNCKLSVDGLILAREVVVSMNHWADYVFNKEYNLMPIEEVKKFINDNKHLPGIPKGNEITENGLNIGDANRLLMQKIEELTLYIIQMEESKKELEKRINKLEQKGK